MKTLRTFDVITFSLLVIGGINWGFYGAFNFDLVASIFGGDTTLLSRVTYMLVGLSAIYQAFAVKGMRYRWGFKQTTEEVHIRKAA